MFFKNEYHENLFNLFLIKLNNKDPYCTGLSYLLSAIERVDILEALDNHNIDYELLLNMSKAWADSEKALLEAAWQIFNGSNFLLEGEKFQFLNMDSIFRLLDSNNSKIVIDAITLRYV